MRTNQKNSTEKQMDNAYDLGKHVAKLHQCEQFIFQLNLGNGMPQFLNDAEKFVNDTYAEIYFEDTDIALAHTGVPRNMDRISQLRINLNAINCMLNEIIAKEREKLKNDVTDNVTDKQE